MGCIDMHTQIGRRLKFSTDFCLILPKFREIGADRQVFYRFSVPRGNPPNNFAAPFLGAKRKSAEVQKPVNRFWGGSDGAKFGLFRRSEISASRKKSGRRLGFHRPFFRS
jgi:hypothetical protein